VEKKRTDEAAELSTEQAEQVVGGVSGEPSSVIIERQRLERGVREQHQHDIVDRHPR